MSSRESPFGNYTLDDRKSLFHEMLNDMDILGTTKWQEVQAQTQNDWRFTICKTTGERKQFLSEYQSKRIKYDRDQKKLRYENAKTAFKERLISWSKQTNDIVNQILDGEMIGDLDEMKTVSNVTFSDIANMFHGECFWKDLKEEELDDLFQSFMEESPNAICRYTTEKLEALKINLLESYSSNTMLDRMSKWDDVIHIMTACRDPFFICLPMSERLSVWEKWLYESDRAAQVEKKRKTKRENRKKRENFRSMILNDYSEDIIDGTDWSGLHELMKDKESYIDLIGTHNSSQPYDIYLDVVKEIHDKISKRSEDKIDDRINEKRRGREETTNKGRNDRDRKSEEKIKDTGINYYNNNNKSNNNKTRSRSKRSPESELSEKRRKSPEKYSRVHTNRK